MARHKNITNSGGRRGFGTLDAVERREMARKGGEASHGGTRERSRGSSSSRSSGRGSRGTTGR